MPSILVVMKNLNSLVNYSLGMQQHEMKTCAETYGSAAARQTSNESTPPPPPPPPQPPPHRWVSPFFYARFPARVSAQHVDEGRSTFIRNAPTGANVLGQILVRLRSAVCNQMGRRSINVSDPFFCACNKHGPE